MKYTTANIKDFRFRDETEEFHKAVEDAEKAKTKKKLIKKLQEADPSLSPEEVEKTVDEHLAKPMRIATPQEQKFMMNVKMQNTREAVQTLLLSRMKPAAIDVIFKFLNDNEYIFTERQDDEPPMYIYRDGIYVPEARTYIRALCEHFCGEGYTKNISNEVIARVEATTYISPEELYEIKDPFVIPVLNGLLHLKTRELEEYTPHIRFFTKIPITFNPMADCPVVKDFFKNTVGDDNIVVMQEQFGYTLVRSYPIAKCFLYNGEGRNGKSTVIQLQKEFLGPTNLTSIPLQDLETDVYAASELFGKLACIGGDLSSEGLKNTGTFKMLTGGDTISANRKFMKRITFRNYAKLIFSANRVPYSRDDSDGFFARFVIIDFPNKFYTTEEIENMPEEERSNVRVADRHIIDKLTTPEELSGLLNWALEGLRRILEKGSFSTTQTTESIKQLYMRKSDSLKTFFSECCSTEDASALMPKEDFKNAYLDYCKEHNLPVKGDKAIVRIMKDNEIYVSKSGSIRLWNGISFIKKEEIGQLGQLGHDFQSRRKVSDQTGDTKQVSNLSNLSKFEEKPLHQQILDCIKNNDSGDGTTIECVIASLQESEEVIEKRIAQLLTSGWIIEIRPGRLKLI